MWSIPFIFAAFTAMLPILPVVAAEGPSITAGEKLSWMPAEGLPPGAEVAVLYGNPTAEGPFAIRFKLPSDYEIPTHSHTTAELITVLSGNARMALGEDATDGNAQVLAAGAFMSLPAGA